MTKTTKILMVLVFFLATMAWGASEKKEYVVKDGDTLSNIIWALRAQKVDVTKLGEWNPEHGTRVTVGEKIIYYLPDIQTPAPQISKSDIKQAVKEAVSEITPMAQQHPETTPGESKTVKYLAFAGVAIIVLLAIVVGNRMRSPGNQRTNLPTEYVSAKVFPAIPFVRALDGIPVDPTKIELNEYDRFPLAIFITLEKEQVMVPAMASLHGNDHSIIVRFGDGRYVAFDKRRQAAATWAAHQPVDSLISTKTIL